LTQPRKVALVDEYNFNHHAALDKGTIIGDKYYLIFNPSPALLTELSFGF
jgi:hypothetical protein